MGMFHADGFRWWRGSGPVPGRGDEHGPPSSGSLEALDAPVWVIYASETGAAEDFAQDACRRLKTMGRTSRLVPIDAINLDELAGVDRALFTASTFDDGEPPFMAEGFDRNCMQRPASLTQLRYGLLALGDRRYDDFCAFGRKLHQWLVASGARAMFDPVEMDNEDACAMRQWHESLRVLGTESDANRKKRW